MDKYADIGVVGLGVMGASLALNIAERGHAVAVYNHRPERVDAFMARPDAARFDVRPFRDLAQFVAAIRKPAPIILMVAAGKAVDEMIDQLLPHLSRGDIVIDAGNSFYRDSVRRNAEAAGRGLEFVGMGVSGGEEGARRGPSLMPGGSPDAYRRIEPILLDIAARAGGDPCCAYIGPDGAGHYVKMVHNGIEYADMQLIAEAYYVLKHIAGLDHKRMQEVFAEWNRGELSSYLIEITADILGRTDPDTGNPLVEMILDRAGQKGTGAWTSESALVLGVPAPTIIEAVQARSLSALKDERLLAAGKLAGPKPEKAGKTGDALVAAVRDALYAAKICCYAQGFALLKAAGKEYGWDLNFGEISMLWRGGCIIRAVFLSRIRDAYDKAPDLPNLLLDPYFAEKIDAAQGGWREVVALTARTGVPAPAFASALSYYDGYRTGALWANLIQAQRDYFGAHTYQRVDKEGTFHTDWSKGAKGTGA